MINNDHRKKGINLCENGGDTPKPQQDMICIPDTEDMDHFDPIPILVQHKKRTSIQVNYQ